MGFFNGNAEVKTTTGAEARAIGDQIRARNAAQDAQMSASLSRPSAAPAAAAAETYATEQPTEQRTTLSETVVEANRDAPADVTQENTSPPEESIDVVQDFDWTSSVNKQQLMNKIPFIRLKEFKITADNAINAVAAGVFAWADMQKSGAGAVGMAANAVGAAMDQIEFIKNVKDSKFSKVVASAGGTLNESIDKFVESAKQNVSKVQTPADFGPEGQHLMDIYGGLYARESTGRTYTFPYYENEYFSASNSFDETTTVPFMNEVFESVSKAANTLPALVEPGVYVQRPKFYKFESDGNQFSFSITLYNTITPLAYLKNSKLVQQLALNNLPRRKTKIVVDPPCIYEVLIPGKAFFPYCFISDLRVQHVGTKRLIEGEIVPDAFEVQITIKSLTTDANNFYEKQMLHHGLTFATPEETSPVNNGTNQGESGNQRNAVVGAPAQAVAANNTPVVEDRDKVIPLDRNGNATDGSGDSIYNHINKPGASPTFVVPPEQKYMFNKPTPVKQSFGVEG
jgi:hypothetical protein